MRQTFQGDDHPRCRAATHPAGLSQRPDAKIAHDTASHTRQQATGMTAEFSLIASDIVGDNDEAARYLMLAGVHPLAPWLHLSAAIARGDAASLEGCEARLPALADPRERHMLAVEPDGRLKSKLHLRRLQAIERQFRQVFDVHSGDVERRRRGGRSTAFDEA